MPYHAAEGVEIEATLNLTTQGSHTRSHLHVSINPPSGAAGLALGFRV